MRICATLCMFCAIIVTAGIGTLVASSYTQGTLPLPESLRFVQQGIPIGGGSAGEAGRGGSGADVLASEVSELRQQLAQFRAEGAAAKSRLRGGRAGNESSAEEDYVPVVTVGSLRRELDSAVRDVEEAKRRLAGEEVAKRELEERVHKLVLDQQRRDEEEKGRMKAKEEELRARIKEEVDRARDETETKMTNKGLLRDVGEAQGLVAQSKEQLAQAREELRLERVGREEARKVGAAAESEVVKLQAALSEALEKGSAADKGVNPQP